MSGGFFWCSTLEGLRIFPGLAPVPRGRPAADLAGGVGPARRAAIAVHTAVVVAVGVVATSERGGDGLKLSKKVVIWRAIAVGGDVDRLRRARRGAPGRLPLPLVGSVVGLPGIPLPVKRDDDRHGRGHLPAVVVVVIGVVGAVRVCSARVGEVMMIFARGGSGARGRSSWCLNRDAASSVATTSTRQEKRLTEQSKPPGREDRYEGEV